MLHGSHKVGRVGHSGRVDRGLEEEKVLAVTAYLPRALGYNEGGPIPPFNGDGASEPIEGGTLRYLRRVCAYFNAAGTQENVFHGVVTLLEVNLAFCLNAKFLREERVEAGGRGDEIVIKPHDPSRMFEHILVRLCNAGVLRVKSY